MAKSRISVVLGENVRRLRTKGQLTQEALGERTGISAVYISEIERGIRNPTLLILERVAAGLGVSLSELIERRSGR